MKKPWLPPVVVCVALLLAWPFRWEKGPEQNYRAAAVRHLHDRWTGDDWIYTYTAYGVSVEPANNDFLIQFRLRRPGADKQLALEKSNLEDAKNRLEIIKANDKYKDYDYAMNKLTEYEKKKLDDIHKAGGFLDWMTPEYTEWQAKVTAWELRQYRKPIESSGIGGNTPEHPDIDTMVSLRGYEFSQAWKELPEDLRSFGATVIDAEWQVQEHERSLRQAEVDSYIRLELLNPYGRRYLATGIWATLVVASGLWAWRLYARGREVQPR